MNTHNKEQEINRRKNLLAKFWERWKPHLQEVGGAVLIGTTVALCGIFAYWYTMAFGFWVSVLAMAAALIIGGSLTLAFSDQLSEWNKQRKLDKAEKEQDREKLKTTITAAPQPAPA